MLVGVVLVFNLVILRASRLTVAYPNDSAFHLQMVWTAKHLLEQGLNPFAAWFPNLTTGSPLFVQYQSSSAVLTGAIATLVGARQAFAWSLYLLLALWPLCVYWTGRLLGWSKWEAAAAALIAPMLFSVHGKGFEPVAYSWTGNGLWSQLWAMWTLPLAVGCCWRYLTQRKYLFGAVFFLAATIAFHFLMAYLAALILIVLVLLKPSDLGRRAGRAAIVAGGAVLATLWVTLPLLAEAKWTSLNPKQAGTAIDNSYGAPQVLRWLFSGRIFDFGRFPVISLFVLVGLGYCVARFRRDERARVLVGVFVLSLLLFFGRPTLGFVLDLLPGNRALLFQRFVGGVQLAGILLAGVGAVWACRAVGSFARRAIPGVRGQLASMRFPTLMGILAVLVVALVALFPAWTETASYAEQNAAWIQYQRATDLTQGRQVKALLNIADARDGGRLFAGLPTGWGQTFYVGGVQVYNFIEHTKTDLVGQTYRSSSLMSGPEGDFDENNPGDYSLFDVHYVLAPKGLTPEVPATLLALRGDYALWTVGHGHGLFQVVDTRGTITANATDVGTASQHFLRSTLPASAIYPTVAFAGAAAATPTLAAGATAVGAAGHVLASSDHLSKGSATATVVARRTSVVLFKVAFDPGWSATVDGRAVPTEMLAPAMLGVRVTPGVHRIVFTYRGYGSYQPLFAISLLTLVGVAVVPVLWRRRRAKAVARTSRTAPAAS